jgi:hypothetical protein
VDDLRRGRLRRFSTDTLIDMLSRLDADVRIVVHRTLRRPSVAVSTRSKTRALRQLRQLRRPIPSDFAFNREEANQREA